MKKGHPFYTWINSGRTSIMSICGKLYVNNLDKSKGFINPKEFLNEVYLDMKIQKSCKTCIMTLNQIY